MKISLNLCLLLCLGIATVNAGVRWPQDPATENMAHASLEFGWKSYRALRVAPGDNVFFSPYSITNALSMLVLGSTGTTEADLLTVLNAPEEISTRQIHQQLRAESLKLSTERNATIGVANRFYVEQSVVDKVLPKFTNNLRNFYNANMESVPFSSNPGEARRIINNFVSIATHQMIPELLPSNLSPQTKLSLVNAIYFKGLWTKPFNPRDTVSGQFHAKSGDVQADYMHFVGQTVSMPYGECQNGDCQMIALSYTNHSGYALIAIVPKEGLTLESLEANLDHEKLRNLFKSANDEVVNLMIPRFTMKNKFMLKDTLERMGATNIFGNAGAQNSKIFSETVDDSLVDEIVHEAKIEVNEEGTTAAAATATVALTSLRGKSVTLNRPFLFLIADVSNGFVLFWGRVENPTLSS